MYKRKTFLPVPVLIFGVLSISLLAHYFAAAQEIPLDYCDRLPLIRVEAKRPMLFLVDTGSTSILNAKSFVGEPKEIQVTTWSGTTVATPAQQVRLPEMSIGSYQLGGLTLPAIDLSTMGKACGKHIDGILGSDLLDRMGAAIDFKRRVIYFTTVTDRRNDKLIAEANADIQRCVSAFNQSDGATIASCLDDQLAFYSSPIAVYGRQRALDYLRELYLRTGPAPHVELHSNHFQTLGNIAWFEYDFELSSLSGSTRGQGIATCHKVDGHWRIQHVTLQREDTDQ